MVRRIRAIFQSLETRLLLPLSLTVAIVLSVHAMLSFRATQDHFLSLVHADIQRSSGLIRRATHDGMLLNRLDEVQATIERLGEQPDVAAIRVYDKAGMIVLSSHPPEIGREVAESDDTCVSCHADGVASRNGLLEQVQVTSAGPDARVLRHLSLIENVPACATAACHFHPEDEAILGVLDVEMSMAPLEAAIATSRRQLVSTTVILILICGLVAAGFVRRVVVGPARRLTEGTRRIAAGALDTRIDVHGDHELAQLGAAFNGMASELQDAHRELTAWSQTLEEKVARKREELRQAQAQVLHMEKMASLGKLSATVAHELNNPLAGMLTYARLVKRELREQPMPPAVRDELGRYLSLLDKECVRCGDIVHNLLTFARQTGSDMRQVDLNEILDRSLMLVRHHLKIGNVRLRHERLEGDPVLDADAGQIQQALIALLVNAAEAMEEVPPEAREITIRASGDEAWVEISITDSGTGIAPEVLPHIFEPFFSTKGEQESGVGLGLAVVFGIVNRHGGRIDVEAAPGGGTTMRLRLPRAPRAGAEPDDGARVSFGPELAPAD